MNLERPEVGWIIRYSYLWSHENALGAEEGSKDRPSLVVAIAIVMAKGVTDVMVLPITHRRPDVPDGGVAVPPRLKQSLGLDDSPSFVITTEANAFTWPGPDLRAIPPSRDLVYGRVTKEFFVAVAKSFAANRKRGAPIIRRTT